MSVTRHLDWATDAFDLDPIAPAVGPFPRRPFLRALVETLDADRGDHALYETGDALVAVCEEPGRITLAGDGDLTDYHAPLGPGVIDLFDALAGRLEEGTELDLDSLPAEAAKQVAEGLQRAGLSPETTEHEVAAVLELPESWDAYLDAIGKKQRHEVRRKRRRYEDTVGALAHETHTGPDWGFSEFVRLHRLAPGPKGEFMTPEREEFFRRLVELSGWRIDLLRVPGTERASACLFSYVDDEGFYLYNGSYDPDLSEGSPGVALTGSMIEQAIAEGLRRFDFLKGDETYKFRLGADPRPLYRVRATR